MDFNSDNNNNMDDVRVKLNSVRSGRRVSIQEEVVFIENTEKSGCEIYVEEEELKPNIRKDLKKVILLIYLYFLQGIPLGNFLIFFFFKFPLFLIDSIKKVYVLAYHFYYQLEVCLIRTREHSASHFGHSQ